MTSHDAAHWKLQRSSLGTPVVMRLRSRTASHVSEHIIALARVLAATKCPDGAGIAGASLYSPVTAFDSIHSRCDADDRRDVMAHGKTTGAKAASNAGKILSNPKSSKAAKSAAASALSQKHGKRGKR